MAVKLLISGLSGAGKTSLTKDLEKTMVVYHDGKRYPYTKPNITVDDYDDVTSFIDLVTEKVGVYQDKYGELPETIVFDSVSKIFDTMADNCNRKYTGFDIYTNLNREINLFTSFIENQLVANGLNVVLISHAIYDQDTARYNLVASGSFAKRGGFYAEVDDALFVEQKSSKRVIHFRSGKFPARTLQDDLPDFVDAKDFSLQKHIALLTASNSSTEEFSL